jgi:hypothetical protein
MMAAAFRRHPFLGPNTLRHIDQSLAAVSSLPLPPERKRAVLLAIDTYTLGFVRWEVVSAKTDDDAGCMGHQDAPTAAEIDEYIATQTAGGDYPHLSEFLAQDMSLGVEAKRFEVGLEWLLSGIETEVASRAESD